MRFHSDKRECIVAFTLIELLVVISIIAILAGIALPVFSSMLAKGKFTNDLNNLKSIGIGMRLYAQDHDGQMPPDNFAVFSTTNASVYKYVPAFKSWQSKFDTRTPREGEDAPVSYGINAMLLSPSQPAAPGDPDRWGGSLDNALAPSTLALATANFAAGTGRSKDVGSWVLTAKNTCTVPPNCGNMSEKGLDEGGNMAVVFADSSVRSVRMKAAKGQLPDPKDNLRFNPMVDPSMGP